MLRAIFQHCFMRSGLAGDADVCQAKLLVLMGFVGLLDEKDGEWWVIDVIVPSGDTLNIRGHMKKDRCFYNIVRCRRS